MEFFIEIIFDAIVLTDSLIVFPIIGIEFPINNLSVLRDAESAEEAACPYELMKI